MNLFAALAPTAMATAGSILKAKDANNTGADDAIGSILVAGAPAVELALNGSTDTSKIKKAMTAIRDAAQAYLDSTP